MNRNVFSSPYLKPQQPPGWSPRPTRNISQPIDPQLASIDDVVTIPHASHSTIESVKCFLMGCRISNEIK